jgi:hypothetical protein
MVSSCAGSHGSSASTTTISTGAGGSTWWAPGAVAWWIGVLFMVGSACFAWRPHVRSWWIAALNMGGSMAFGVSAAAAHIVPDSGQPRHAELVNLGTFVGALGFLIGAFLLLPERTDSPGPVVAPIPTS